MTPAETHRAAAYADAIGLSKARPKAQTNPLPRQVPVAVANARRAAAYADAIGVPAHQTAAGGARHPSTPVTVNPVTGKPYGPGAYQVGGLVDRLNKAADLHKGPGPVFSSVISPVLDVLQRPAYAVGDLIKGQPQDAWKEAVSGAGGVRGNKTLPSQALRERGLLPGGKLGAGLGLVADVGLDPTTYVTFGAGGAANAAGKVAAHAIEHAAAEAAAKGTRVPLATVARHALAEATARQEAPKALTVGLRVPGTRAKVIPVVQSERAYRALATPIRKVGDTRVGRVAQDLLRPGGTSHRPIHEAARTVEAAAQADKFDLSRTLNALSAETHKREQALNIERGGISKALSLHLDQPDVHPVPPGAEDLARKAIAIRDSFHPVEEAAGIRKPGKVTNYIPHLPASPRDARKLAQDFPGSKDAPFFTKQRQLASLDEWEKLGITPELNVWRLLEARGHAATDALAKKAIDDAAVERYGLTKPPKPGTVAPEPAPGAARVASPEEWKQVKTTWAKVASPYHSKTRVPPDVAHGLERARQRIEGATRTPSDLQGAADFINKVGRSWKSLALLSPGFHARNIQDDGLRAWLAGARDPRSFVQAAQIMRGKDVAVKIGGKTLSGRQLLAEATATGAIDRGFIGHEVGRHTEIVDRGKLLRTWPGQGRVASVSKNLGQLRENATRLGTYIERRKAGDHAFQAARTVREFHFDYGDVGALVGAARRFFLPFVTYPTKATAFVAKTAVTRPGTLANIAKTQNALNQAAGNPDLSLLPVGARNSFALPFGLPGVPSSKDKPLLFNPERTFFYAAPNVFDPTQVQREFLSGLPNPLVRVPVELATGHRFYYAGNAPKLVAASRPAQALNAMLGGLPGYVPASAPNAKRDAVTGQPVPGLSPTLDEVLSLLPAYGQARSLTGGTSDSTLSGPYRYLGGLSVSPFDRARALARAQRFGGR